MIIFTLPHRRGDPLLVLHYDYIKLSRSIQCRPFYPVIFHIVCLARVEFIYSLSLSLKIVMSLKFLSE